MNADGIEQAPGDGTMAPRILPRIGCPTENEVIFASNLTNQ